MQQLEQDPDFWRDLVENINELVQSVRPDGSFRYVNRAWRETLGYSREEVSRLSVFDVIHPSSRSHCEEIFQRVLRGEEFGGVETTFLTKNGLAVLLEASINCHFKDGRPVATRTILRNISERKRAEELLQESEARFRLLFEGANDAIFLADAETGILTHCNLAAETLLGRNRAEIVGRHQTFLHPPEEADLYLELFRSHVASQANACIEGEVIRKDGRRVVVSISPSVTTIGNQKVIQGIFRDITERKRAEEEHRHFEIQVRHTQKLESLGVLAGGIAHDFNNLLTPIVGYAGLALMRLSDESPIRPMLCVIERAARRAADLAQQMLAYSGKGKLDIQVFRLDALVQEMIELLGTAISRKATLDLDLRPAAIEGDATQIRQVVLNLIINASDALEDRVGTICVRTGIRQMDAENLNSPFSSTTLPVGAYAYLEVEDNGCGMSADTVAKIFDPFFTTKFTGRGLGLATVLGIVHSHNGAIQVTSRPGQGAVFQVFLPCVNVKTNDVSIASHSKPPPRGQGTVLIIEDEEGIRDLIRNVIASVGFQALEAVDGHDGLDLFQRREREIDLVLLDLTMPRLDGVEVLQELRRLRSDIPVVVMSGYTEQDVSRRFADLHVSGFLAKPFRLDDLLTLICQLLPSKPPDECPDH